MTGRTYDISGTADGFLTDNPSFGPTAPSRSRSPADVASSLRRKAGSEGAADISFDVDVRRQAVD